MQPDFYTGEAKDDPNRLGDVTRPPAAHSPAVHNAVIRTLRGSPADRASFDDLYAAAAKAQPGLTKHDFQKVVAHMEHAGHVRLRDWPAAIDDVPDPELAFMDPATNKTLLYNAALGDGASLLPEPAAPAAPLTLGSMRGAATRDKVAGIERAASADGVPEHIAALNAHGVGNDALRTLAKEHAAGGIDPAAVLADAVRARTGKTYTSGGQTRPWPASDTSPADVAEAARRHRAKKS